MQITRVATPPQRRLTQAQLPSTPAEPAPQEPPTSKTRNTVCLAVGTVVGAAAGVATALNPGVLAKIGGGVLTAGPAALGTTLGVGAVLFSQPGPSGHTAGWGAAVARGLGALAAGVAGGIGGGIAGYALGGQASVLSMAVLGAGGAATGLVAGSAVDRFLLS